MLLRTILSRELILLGLRDLRAHKLRSSLTALGMIFGVGAVIAMLSIGESKSAEQLERIRELGSDNIIIRSIEPQQSQEARQENTSIQEYGIRRNDVTRIKELPDVVNVAQVREVANDVRRVARKLDCSVVGVTQPYFNIVSTRLARGRALSTTDYERAAKVCLIGSEVAEILFHHEDPLGEVVTVSTRATGPVPYYVVGILEPARSAGGGAGGSATSDTNRTVFIPMTTADFRYGDLRYRRTSGSREIKRIEVSELYVRAASQNAVLDVAGLVERVMVHDHKQRDYEVIVPLALLNQAQRLKRDSQIVLGSIAGISLLVGGIGIMNIMLASVTQRTREIGIRRALGAKKADIAAQFLIETIILSVCGGLVGIVLGIAFAKAAGSYFDFQALIPLWGVVLSFLVSVSIGISFGLYPAKTAAALDPIEALRYE